MDAAAVRAVFRLALRQTEGLIGSIIGLLGLDLAVPDHITLSRRAATLEVPRPQARRNGEFLHLPSDSTGLKLCGAGGWLLERYGTKTRRFWRRLHIGLDAGSGQTVAASLTAKEVDDGAEASLLLDRITGAAASFTGDGKYDQDRVCAGVAEHYPEAAVTVPPRSMAVPSASVRVTCRQPGLGLLRPLPRSMHRTGQLGSRFVALAALTAWSVPPRGGPYSGRTGNPGVTVLPAGVSAGRSGRHPAPFAGPASAR